MGWGPTGSESERMREWWVFLSALGGALLALWALVGHGPSGLPVPAKGPPPLDHHDDRSRAELERVLREADAEVAP